MKTRWWMMNVVWYDGCDAFVSKFIGKLEPDSDKPTEETEGMIGQYLNGNGEVLKIDPRCPVTLEDILVLRESEDINLKAAYDRFKEMWL